MKREKLSTYAGLVLNELEASCSSELGCEKIFWLPDSDKQSVCSHISSMVPVEHTISIAYPTRSATVGQRDGQSLQAHPHGVSLD